MRTEVRRALRNAGLVGVLFCAVLAAHGQSVVISEFMACNTGSLLDEDGVASDWLELHNTGAALSLQGWYLTDDPDDLTKWELPDAVLPADGYLVVFASDKNRKDPGAPLHANFKLDSNAGYVALVRPDGATIAHAYGPSYVVQYADVSYGLSGAAVGYLQTPTPGQANGALRPQPPQITPGAFYFTNTITVTIVSDVPNATIRFTLNGTDPNATTGLTYTRPITASGTFTLRAVVVDPATGVSPMVARHYVRLNSALTTFNSNLPLVVVHTLGAGLDQDHQTRCAAEIIDVGTDGRARLTAAPQYLGVLGMKIRGSSSTGFPKVSYSVETWDQNGEEYNTGLLGMPSESDWVLYGPYTDKTLLRNVLAYQWSNAIGRYAVRTRPVELFLNTSGGVVTSSQYVGTYVLMEKIKRDKNRVNIAKLRVSDSTAPEVTGGYIIKKDRLDPGDAGFTLGSGQVLAYVEPKEQEITPAQQTYLTGFLNEFESVLNGANFADPVNGYAAYIDTDAFIDHHLLTEMLKNIDGFRFSSYMYKPRGGKLHMGPIWDYDLALGNANYNEGYLPQNWYHTLLSAGDYPWYGRLFQDPAFQTRYADRWFALRAGPLKTSTMLADIDTWATKLNESAGRNFTTWPILGQYVWPNPDGYASRTTYQTEIDWMKNWLTARLAWIDAQFMPPPIFNQDGGPVQAGFQLTMSNPPGVAGTIVYTLDGTDPHLATTATVTLVPESAGKRVRVPTASLSGWQSVAFDDTAWTYGTGAVGYERATGYGGLFNIDVGNAMYNVNGTCYIRIHFDLNADTLASLQSLHLRARYDDAFVATLNGVEVARSANLPAPLSWNSLATTFRDDALAVELEDFNITGWLGTLQPGPNVLAIQALNSPIGSSDFLFSVDLVADTVSGTSATPYTGPITLNQNAQVKARIVNGAARSALKDATFTTGPVNVVINELMAENHTIVDPDEPGAYPDWFELYNPGPGTAFLGGMYLSDDVANTSKFQIPAGLTIPAGGYLVFWADEDGSQGPTHVNFKLSKSGESVSLYDTTASGHGLIDRIVFGAQQSDVSYGRGRDGGSTWVFLPAPSPGTSNDVTGDFTGDARCDAADANFALSGPDVTTPPVGCPADLFALADFDHDGDVDLTDVAVLQGYANR